MIQQSKRTKTRFSFFFRLSACRLTRRWRKITKIENDFKWKIYFVGCFFFALLKSLFWISKKYNKRAWKFNGRMVFTSETVCDLWENFVKLIQQHNNIQKNIRDGKKSKLLECRPNVVNLFWQPWGNFWFCMQVPSKVK